VDDEWLAEPLRQLLTHQAREDVSWAASGKGDDHAHRPRRIGLRPHDPRDGRQRGSARCQMQKLSARKFQCPNPGGTEQPNHGCKCNLHGSSDMSLCHSDSDQALAVLVRTFPNAPVASANLATLSPLADSTIRSRSCSPEVR